jgi:microcystin-dependent protein
MPLEVMNWIKDFVATNPVGATDPKSEGDDHLRGIKRAILANLPNLGEEAVKMSASQLNGFTGMVAAFPLTIVEGTPTGWLRCNGAAHPRALYPDLYNMIGVIYGPGNGVDDFVVPDYRGTFLRDQDEGIGNDPDVTGRTDRGDGGIGDVVGSRQGDANQSHLHTQTAHTHTMQNFVGDGNPDGQGDLGGVYYRRSAGAVTTDAATPAIAASGAGDARPKNVYVRHMIHI